MMQWVRLHRWISLFAGVFLLTFIAATVVWQGIMQKKPVDQAVVIAAGSSSYAVSEQLARAGVINSARLFRLYVRWKGLAASLKAGEYQLTGTMGIPEVAQKLTSGQVKLYRVTVPEGLRTDEMLHVLAKGTGTDAQNWFAALDELLPGEGVEGRLLPETYTYPKPVNPKAMLKTMIQAQQKVLDALSGSPDIDNLRITASIIEKETRLDAERPLVSAVIRNRLEKNMRLQMDPTVIYGIWRTQGEFSGNIRRKDLHEATPWNTYVIRGLPPTPICNPGKQSLLAAAAPADVDYLYFVADGSGGHAFAATLEEHQKNVKTWVRLERQR